MCIDYRMLKKWIYVDLYPLPYIDEIFYHLAYACYFTKLDQASRY